MRPHIDLCQLSLTAGTVGTFRPAQAHYVCSTAPGMYRQKPGTPMYIVYKGTPFPETKCYSNLFPTPHCPTQLQDVHYSS